MTKWMMRKSGSGHGHGEAVSRYCLAFPQVEVEVENGFELPITSRTEPGFEI